MKHNPNQNSIMARVSSVVLSALLALGNPGFVVHAENACTHENTTTIVAVSPNCTEPGNNEYLHCEDCGAYLKPDRVTTTTVDAEIIPAFGHSISGPWETSDTEHWRVCAIGCGTVERESHSFSILHASGDECSVCGRTRTEHEHAYSSTYVHDVNGLNGHWQVCMAPDCNDTTTPVAHDINPATGNCSACGYHVVCVPSTTWSFDETEHWKACAGCGRRLENIAAHSFSDDGICQVCGARRFSSSSGNNSSSNYTSSSDGGSSSGSDSGDGAVIAQIKANDGNLVIVEADSLSGEVMDALSTTPGATVVVHATRDGAPISIPICDPIITERVPYYGVENLVGIYNRSEAMRVFKEEDRFNAARLEYIKMQLIVDAINAINGEPPKIQFPAGGNYIYQDKF